MGDFLYYVVCPTACGSPAAATSAETQEKAVAAVWCSHLFGSLLAGMERFRCGRCSTQESFRAEILVDIRPVNTVPSATDLPI